MASPEEHKEQLIFPRSLEELKRPSRGEVEEAVRTAEQDILDAKKARRGKLLPTDEEMETIYVGPGVDKDMLKTRVGGDECLIRADLTTPPSELRRRLVGETTGHPQRPEIKMGR